MEAVGQLASHRFHPSDFSEVIRIVRATFHSHVLNYA
jgi:hypothetical protein